MSETEPAAGRHRTSRVRREPRRREITVTAVTDLAPRYRRIEFSDPGLGDFESLAPDDHIKLFLPDPSAPGGMAMRDFTPRRYDRARLSLTIDFALHEDGPATRWARAARPGDRLAIGGPRGSLVVADDFDWYLLIGDETALPAICRRLEELRPGVPVRALLLVDAPADALPLDTATDLTASWVCRGPDDDGAEALLAALDGWKRPAGDGYVWIAAEARVARRLRDRLAALGHPAAWMKAAGYWVRGAAGQTEKFDEAAPSAA